MSLQNLISGAECALPANPLAQVLKHTEGDRTLQRDRLAGPSTSRLHQLPPSATISANERDISLARQFFDSNAPNIHAPSPHILAPNIPHAELARRLGTPVAPVSTSGDLQDAWTRMEMQKQRLAQHRMQEDSMWAAEFGNAMPQMSIPGSSNQSYGQPQQNFARSSYMPQGSFMQNGMQMGGYGMDMMSSSPFENMHDQKGKGKGRAEDFEAAFAQFSSSALATTQSARIVEVQDSDTEGIEAALAHTGLDDTRVDDGVDSGTTFQKVWDELQKSDIPPAEKDLAKWEAEFNQLMSSQRDETDLDFGSGMKEAWESGLGDYDQTNALKFTDQGIPLLGDYVFETNNKYLADNTTSPLAQAKALLEQNGSLTEAALLLEAAIQKGDLGEGGYEAWILLGDTRSMDEREEAGMRALTEGVKRAEAAGARGAGMLSLAISYTNESFEKASLTTLFRWLVARFPDYTPPPETSASLSNSPWDSQQRVKDAFLTIAREQHASGVVDPDVQTGLGVLYYNSGDFERAKDCFESALTVRPKDYLLWNRLGSALSNGNKPEEALWAYREALQMRPTYTRAIYNVGVACLNIGAHKEASEHFLSALALQDTTEGEKSEQLWFTLRRALVAMNREDLADKAKAGGGLDVFRAEGFDF
ncbi:peroxisome targeting signal receptor [Rickenella mellea]|uniref:Peroxisome targeting signal receptor n=1 Tax=Rickenella mellea TaxID=50990 RepID=A0A4Y7QFN2_9AGAM|nr:peroxisome targeting signal receptor [Rickenella mellea]